MPPFMPRHPDVAALTAHEAGRQNATLTLIASENYASTAILDAAGSALTNKYANGYPGFRDYPGCEVCDAIEDLAQERLCRLFGTDHANVQPYSGSVANLAVYCAVLNPGDRILSMRVLAAALTGEGFSPVTGGTDTHLLILDLAGEGMCGIEAEEALYRAGIAADRCPVPGRGEGYDTAGGIRLVTPAATTRGMGEEEMKALASLIADVLRNTGRADRIGVLRREVDLLARTFPISP